MTRHRRPKLEPLEVRRLLATGIFWNPSEQAVVIRGTPGNDVASVRVDGVVSTVTLTTPEGNFFNRFPGVQRVEFHGEAGDDDFSNSGALPSRAFGGEGNDVFSGGDADDYFEGGPGEDNLAGYLGDDWLDGGADNDSLRGGLGDDVLLGGAGDDGLAGVTGNDLLLGGAGDDALSGGDGRDFLIGGVGLDTLRGNNDGDLLIGESTLHDDHVEMLRMKLAEWSLDLPYDERVDHLMEGHHEATTFMPGVDVPDDQAADVISGDAGSDWFVWFSNNELRDRSLAEHVAHVGGHVEPALIKEHQAVMNLVPLSAVTHTAERNGPWSDPATWLHGEVPGENANVHIPDGITVTVDGILTRLAHTVRVDGVLNFATHVDTRLTVDTLVVAPSGRLEIGTPDRPIAPNVQASIAITGRGPIDAAWDPLFFSRGIISHGAVIMQGAEQTPFLELAVPPRAGDTRLVLAAAPVGWRVGERIILAGVDPRHNQDEIRVIRSIAGNFVEIEPLAYDHVPPHRALQVHVASMERNIAIYSRSRDVAERGHIMFMHSDQVHIANALFLGLGRTDKTQIINDSLLDAQGRLIPGTGTNPRGRYAVHFHRTGLDADHGSAVIEGSVVRDSPGWGFVNHSSQVVMEGNFAFNVVGAGFVGEAGDEAGVMRHNFALRSSGSANPQNSRVLAQDFGHQGHGFWMQGNGVELIDNVVAGQASAAFVLKSTGLIQSGLGETRFPSRLLADPSWAGDEPDVDVSHVPISTFTGNVAYASAFGLEIWNHVEGAPHELFGVVEDMAIWNVRQLRGVQLSYSDRIVFRNVWIRGDLNNPQGHGIATNYGADHVRLENVRIEGWETGIDMPVGGMNTISGGYFRNVVNIAINKRLMPNRVQLQQDMRRIDIDNAVTFAPLDPAALQGREPWNIALAFDPHIQDYRDLSHLFEPEIVTFRGEQLYFAEQAFDAIPFPAELTDVGFPAELAGKTSQSLWNEYGLAFGGAVAPSDAHHLPGVQGLVGRPATYLPTLHLSNTYSHVLNDYHATYIAANGRTVVDRTGETLHEGWNVVTRRIGGHTRSFLAFGDTQPPEIVVQPATPTSIPMAALSAGFAVYFNVVDNGYYYTDSFIYRFTGADLMRLPIQSRADGAHYLTLEFPATDQAGNTTLGRFELTLT